MVGRMTQAHERARGFTLIELLVVMVIVALLITLAAPRYFGSLQKSKETALRQTLATVQVDRGQMAVYVARSMVRPLGDAGMAGYTPPTTPTFSDVGLDFWSYAYVEYLAAQGTVSGYVDHTYRPTVAVSRNVASLLTVSEPLTPEASVTVRCNVAWPGKSVNEA